MIPTMAIVMRKSPRRVTLEFWEAWPCVLTDQFRYIIYIAHKIERGSIKPTMYKHLCHRYLGIDVS